MASRTYLFVQPEPTSHEGASSLVMLNGLPISTWSITKTNAKTELGFFHKKRVYFNVKKFSKNVSHYKLVIYRITSITMCFIFFKINLSEVTPLTLATCQRNYLQTGPAFAEISRYKQTDIRATILIFLLKVPTVYIIIMHFGESLCNNNIIL